MTDDVQLQILPGLPAPLIALTSRGAQVGAVSAQPMSLPAIPPADGEALWRALPESVRTILAALHTLQPGTPLPLWLDVQVPALAIWPWELLAPPTPPGALPFSLLPQTPLVRYYGAGSAPIVRPGVLRVLALTATPRDQAAIDTEPVLTLLKHLHQPERIAVTAQERCRPDDLRRLLGEVQPDLLLMAAHGEPGAILLQDRNGDSVPLTAGELGALIAGTSVQAVVLLSCDSATPVGDARSVAETLLAAGTVGVVAMQRSISLSAAVAFLDGLLDSVALGQTLESATVAGRKAIVARLGMGSGEWAVPVCWQRVLHRPLVLPPGEAVRRGAARLTERAPAWATQLAAGGWLGLLAVCSLQSLFLPATVAVPAVVKLLEGLGLNIFAGYLGSALQDVWRRAGKQPSDTVSAPDVATALAQIALRQDDAATQIDQLARTSGALEQTVAAINYGTAGSEALLRGIGRDLQRHGVALDGLRADLRHGLAAVYQTTLGIQADTRAIRQTTDVIRDETHATRQDVGDIKADTQAIRAGLDAEGEKRHERQQALLNRYLEALVNQYEQVTLSRFIDVKKGTGESTVNEPFLQNVYVALTTDRTPIVSRLEMRPARKVRRALKFFARRQPAVAPARLVRLFDYQPPSELYQHSGAQQQDPGDVLENLLRIPAAEGWIADNRSDYLRWERPIQIRLRRPELVVEALAPLAGRQRRVVLLGDPGSGKSTVLRYMTVLLSQALLGQRALDLAGWGELRVPLLLPLGTLARRFTDNGDDLMALGIALAEVLDGDSLRPRQGLGDTLSELLPRSILLLDGLDELALAPSTGGLLSQSLRHRATRAIKALARQLPETPIVVTCRVLPYRTTDKHMGELWQFPQGEGWQERTVQPFAFGQVRQFVRGWYGASMRDEQLAQRRADSLITELEANKALREAITPSGLPPTAKPSTSPMLLTMLTILHFNSDGRALPPERDELYEKLVDLLLHRWEPNRSKPVYQRDDLLQRLNIKGLKGSTEPLRRVLHQVTYEAHRAVREGGDGRGVLDGGLLRARFQTYFESALECDTGEAAEKVMLFLEILRDEAGLLTRIGDDAYALPHLTFEEYLAGCYFADRPDPVRQAYDHWRSADFDRWREPLLLMCGRLRQTGNAAREGVRWLKRLASPRYPISDDELRDKDPAQRQRDALMAVECYEILGRRTRIDREQWEEVEGQLRQALLSAIPSPNPAHHPVLYHPPAERARAALALAQIGDLRLGVCMLPSALDDPYWCNPFPSGNYLIADGARVTHLKAFRIARYPVTMWQFRQFWLDSTGYENQEHWPEQGWTWKQERGGEQSGRVNTQPLRWDNPDWTADNQPVSGVSWYESVAFCHWLTVRGRKEGWLRSEEEIRLPSEAEWEVAAMWDMTTNTMCSWQSPEDELWQNVKEAGIDRTSPVGLFPQGVSPCGALDMAGNVWEWCASSYLTYPRWGHQIHLDYPRRLGLALRGGSYSIQNKDSGWGARRGYDPSNQDGNWGFRVVVCSRSLF